MATQVVPLTLTRLFSAVKKGQLDVIENPLRLYGLPKNGSKTTDYLILQTALENNYREIAKLLIEVGCRVKALPTDTGLTPLALTFIREDEQIALMIMKQGTTVYVDHTMKSTVLHLAVRRESLKMLRFIFLSNIDVNFLDSDGKTALQILLEIYTPQVTNYIKVLEMVKFLLSKGASVNFRSSNGKTALHYIASLGQKFILTSVLQNIVNINLRDDQGRTALHYLLSSDYTENDIFQIVELFIAKGARIDIVDQHNITVAHIAAGKKHLKILSKFLQCQCNVNLQDHNGNTILHKILENSLNLADAELCMRFVNPILSMAQLENVQNSLGKTPLHLAAENHHYKIVGRMLPKFVNVNVADNNGETLLHIMLRNFSNRNYHIIKQLLNAGADVGIKNTHGMSSIDLAMKTKNRNLVLLVLRCSRNLNQYFFQNKSVLHYLSNIEIANQNEELQVIKLAKACVEQGIHINVLDDLNQTPLHSAVLNQNKCMIEFLMKHGANPNYVTSNGTIIEYLIRKSPFSNVDLDIANMLVSKGAGMVITHNGLISLLTLTDSTEKRLFVQKLLNKCRTLNVLDSYGNTVLHIVLNSDNIMNVNETNMINMIKIFLERGVSIDAKNEGGITALHLAAKNKYYLTAEFLMKNRVNVTTLDNKGNSVLHFASMSKAAADANLEKRMIDSFIEKGCNVNCKNISNMTPLMTAIQSGCISVFKALIDHGADKKCTFGENLSTPLHIAAEYNNVSVIEYLLDCGANVYDKRKDGKTALHVAAVAGQLDATRILLERWTDPDAKDYNGRTALHWACWHGKREIAKLLLMLGADVNAIDKCKVTPLMLSQDSSNAVWTELQIYIAILQTAGVEIARQSINCINNYKKRINTTSLVALARSEVLLMRQRQIDNNTTLADVLKMKRDKLTVFVNNSAFKKLIKSERFQYDFLLYSAIIKSLYPRAQLRNHLAADAANVFRRIAGLAMPNDCTEEILKFLNNEDLINLIQAIQSKIIKKKRICSGTEECTPSKIVKRNNE